MEVRYEEIKTINDFIDAVRIRVDVFIKEQGFQPGWEPDDDDKVSKHFIAITDGKIVSTARLRKISECELKIERMATIKEYRGNGIGKGLLEYIIGKAIEQKPKRLWVRSQVLSQRFYEKCGFAATSKPYELWGHAHIDMEYSGNLRK